MSGGGAGGSSKQKIESSKQPDNKRKRGVFQKDLQHMMYGYGDDQNPLRVCSPCRGHRCGVHKAQDVASKRGKLLTEDFLFVIRKDFPKLNRATELLAMNEELKQARKAFDMDEEKLVSGD